MAALTDLTLGALKAAMDKKEASAVEVTDAHLKKLDEHRALNAFITETPDRAREADDPHSLVVKFGADKPLRLDAGVELSPFQIAYQTYGSLNPERSNAILVCHALTGDQHVANIHPVTGKSGWWETMVGPGRPIDTETAESNGSDAVTISPSKRRKFPRTLLTTRWRATNPTVVCAGSRANAPADGMVRPSNGRISDGAVMMFSPKVWRYGQDT